MPDFTPNARKRVAAATREVERSMRNPPGHRGRWQGSSSYSVWMFELLAVLPEGVCNHPVLARRRFWDQTLCNGKGAFATSADTADNFYVGDYREVGYYGSIGSLGAAEIRNPGTAGMPRSYSGLMLGVIVDLECPPGVDLGVDRVFELKTSLSPGGVATAYLRYEIASACDETDTGTTFVVWDYIGDRQGTGRDDNQDGSPGAIGLAVRLPGEETWRIIDLECYFPPVVV